MWSIDGPTCTATEVALACSKSVRDKELRARIAASVAEMETNNGTLKSLAKSDLMHTISSTDVPVPKLSALELKDLYRKQLAREGSKARPFYDRILGNSKHGLCTYCRYGQADTLDHFVPKSTVPELSVDPYNLVPCCSRCNHELLDSFSAAAANQMLHPYIAIDLGRWLHAEVEVADSGVVKFYAIPPTSLSESVRVRIVNQFRALKLDTLYSVVSGQELSGLARTLKNNFPGDQGDEVSTHLRNISDEAFAADANDRRAVMYEALADSTWYCEGGYLAVVA